MHTLLALLFLTIGACDFDIPEKFEMPTWYLDLKIPLVQTRYQMVDISDSTSGIFIADDSLGFEIIQQGDMTEAAIPEWEPVPINLEQSISSGEIPGINLNIVLPGLSIEQKINVVLYNQKIYQDTAAYCTTITVLGVETVECFTDPETGDTLGIPFSFPTDSVRTMSHQDYNNLIVTLFDEAIGILSSILDTTFNLGLSSIPLPDNPSIIASIDTLRIGHHPTNSVYRTYFGNNGIPTPIKDVYSIMTAGNNNLLLIDTLAGHDQISTISNGQAYADTTDLSGKGLTSYLKLSTNMSLTPATDFVTIPPGSLYVDFKMNFQLSGIDSIDVTTNSYSLSDAIEMPTLELPEMDMTEQGITRMEIYRNKLAQDPEDQAHNQLRIYPNSTMPFDINFLMNFKNFSSEDGQDSVKLDTTLKKDVFADTTFDLKGLILQSTYGDNDNDGWADSAFSKFDILFDIGIPEQKATIPLDGTSLGEFTMDLIMVALDFSEIRANIYMEMPSDPVEQEFPDGQSGAVPTEAKIEIILKNQIAAPIEMLMEFKGYNTLGELTYVPIEIDTVGIPPNQMDTSVTIIALSKLGTGIQIWETVEDYENNVIPWDTLKAPCDTCSTIIDLLASNPTRMLIKPAVKIEGKTELRKNAAIDGGFKLTIPFALQLEPMSFLGEVTEVEEFEYDTRYKIRNSLLESNVVSTITNALPFGAEVSVLMSNYPRFPIDTSRTLLNLFRDSLGAQGILDSLSDSLYIIRNCSEISPDSNSNIYIFDIMTDHSECVDGLPYIVKSNGSGVDTILSYVDTLFKFILPEPDSYFGENDTSGFPEGMVAVPGTGVYPSIIDSSKIFLLTDYGSHYTMPRFYLPGTGNKGVYLTSKDYLEISSFITFTLSSSGAFGSAKNELVITYPNGGQTLNTSENHQITWASYGTSSEKVDLYYSTVGDTNTYKPAFCVLTENWTLIAGGLDNTGTYEWNLSSSGIADTDSLRLKIIASNGEACDINGHYIKIRNSSNTIRNDFLKSKISWSRK